MMTQLKTRFEIKEKDGKIITQTLDSSLICTNCGGLNIEITPSIFIHMYRHVDRIEKGYTKCRDCGQISKLPEEVEFDLAKFICFHSGNAYGHNISCAATDLLWKTGKYFQIKAEETQA